MSDTAINLDAIPAELRERRQWILWKRSKGTKIPVSVAGQAGKSNDARTWATFEEAVKAVGQFGTVGVGYVIDACDSFTGVDLDNAIQDGKPLPWAQEILERFRGVAYAETSPSGQGVKLLTRARKPERSRCSNKWEGKQGLEVYDKLRFWTVTSDVLEEEGFQVIREGQEAVDWLIQKYLAQPEATAPTPRPVEPSAAGADLLTRAQGYVDEAGPAPEGDRNNTAFRLAGGAFALVGDHGERLSEDQLIEFMRAWNVRNSPPLPDDELVRLTRNAINKGTPREEKRSTKVPAGGRNGRGAATNGKPHEFDLTLPEHRTEAAVARRVAKEYAGRIRWCDPWGKWLIWDGRRWKIDDELRIERAVKRVAHDIMAEAKELVDFAWGDKSDEVQAKAAVSFAKSINSAYGVRSVATLARSEPGVPIQPSRLDSDPWALNVQNGTLNLRDGTLRPHRREDLLTKLAPVEYHEDATCPTWRGFLKGITFENVELIGYLRRLVGYCLTGATTEHVLPFMHGAGANGKSTFITALLELLGEDYAMKAPSDLLLAKKQAHPTEVADLYGKRLVACVEAEEGRRLAEGLVKELTGGDRLRARRMREDFWEFEATHKVWLAANHRPAIRGNDHGIWRRVKLIPFVRQFSEDEQDKQLGDKLRAELPGILAWALAGCLEWQAGGLGEPEPVREATARYRADEDTVGAFLAECCGEDTNAASLAADLYKAFAEWCEANGEHVISQKRFGSQLADRGFESARGTGGKKTWKGICLVVNHLND